MLLNFDGAAWSSATPRNRACMARFASAPANLRVDRRCERSGPARLVRRPARPARTRARSTYERSSDRRNRSLRRSRARSRSTYGCGYPASAAPVSTVRRRADFERNAARRAAVRPCPRSSSARIPWPMRSAPSTSTASRTLAAPSASPACATQCNPWERANANASAKRLGRKARLVAAERDADDVQIRHRRQLRPSPWRSRRRSSA